MLISSGHQHGNTDEYTDAQGTTSFCVSQHVLCQYIAHTEQFDGAGPLRRRALAATPHELASVHMGLPLRQHLQRPTGSRAPRTSDYMLGVTFHNDDGRSWNIAARYSLDTCQLAVSPLQYIRNTACLRAASQPGHGWRAGTIEGCLECCRPSTVCSVHVICDCSMDLQLCQSSGRIWSIQNGIGGWLRPPGHELQSSPKSVQMEVLLPGP